MNYLQSYNVSFTTDYSQRRIVFQVEIEEEVSDDATTTEPEEEEEDKKEVSEDEILTPELREAKRGLQTARDAKATLEDTLDKEVLAHREITKSVDGKRVEISSAQAEVVSAEKNVTIAHEEWRHMNVTLQHAEREVDDAKEHVTTCEMWIASNKTVVQEQKDEIFQLEYFI